MIARWLTRRCSRPASPAAERHTVGWTIAMADEDVAAFSLLQRATQALAVDPDDRCSAHG